MAAKRYHVTTILTVLGLLFAAACLSWATLTGTSGDKLVASGTVTRANMKISAVAGTAFVDFSAADVLTTKLGHKLQVCDSTGKCIQGYIKAAGTGETLSATELLIDPGMEDWGNATNLTSWTEALPGSGVVNREATEIHGGTYAANINVGASGVNTQIRQIITPTSGRLNKYSVWAKSDSATPEFALDATYTVTFPITSTYTQYSTYQVASVGFSFALRAYSALNRILYFDDASAKQVLTPSATGATITTTKGGSTYNWANKNSAFNYNDASGYTYRIYKDSRLVQVATGSVTQANTRLSLVDGAGFVELNGVDLTAYQSGLYMIAVYDSANRNVTGFISAAPGGEALGAEINTGTLTANKLYKIVTTEANHFFTGCAIGNYFTSDGTETCDASNTVKEVTDCATTGGLIVSAFGGATRNWNNKNAAFGRKDLTGYTYKIYYIGS